MDEAREHMSAPAETSAGTIRGGRFVLMQAAAWTVIAGASLAFNVNHARNGMLDAACSADLEARPENTA